MSDLKASQQIESFAEKLDIRAVSPRTYADAIEASRLTPRVVVCGVGPSGVGKTAIPRQIASRRKSPYVQFFTPQMPLEDTSIPYFPSDTKEYFDKRAPRKIAPVIEYVKKLRDKHGDDIPDGMQPIIAIEELNRARDKTVTQAMFTLIEDRYLGDLYIDEYIQLVVTMNPSGGQFAVNEFERDPACRRRLSMMAVVPSFGDFIRFATEAGFHEKVVTYLEAQPTWFYDYGAALASKQFCCPASWESVSSVLKALERLKMPFDSATAMAIISGKIGDSATVAFLDYIKDESIVIAPEQVLSGYQKDSEVRRQFREQYLAVDGGGEARNDKTGDLLQNVAVHVFLNLKREPKTFGPQLALFMDDLPEEKLKLFVRHLTDQAKLGDEYRKYLLKFNTLLNSEKYFVNAAKRLQDAEAKVQEERQKSGFANS